jgi:hypothetical protein
MTISTNGQKGVGGTLFAKEDGKGSKKEVLPHPGARTSLTPGNSLSRMMNQYGKGHSFLPGGAQPVGAAGADPQNHAGVLPIRGQKGGIKRNPRRGGLGPGFESAPGTDQDYSMKSEDLE